MSNSIKHILTAVGALVAIVAVVALIIKFFDEICAFFDGLKEKCPCKGHDEFSDYVDDDEIV